MIQIVGHVHHVFLSFASLIAEGVGRASNPTNCASKDWA